MLRPVCERPACLAARFLHRYDAGHFRNKEFFVIGVIRPFCVCALTGVLILCNPLPALADINELQPLNLGRWVVTRNTSQFHITVNTDGSYSNSTQLIMIEPPQQGIYQVTDLPPFTPISSVTVSVFTPLAGDGQSFTLDNFQAIAPPATDGAGETTITLGLRARTSGNGNGYSDTTYNGTLQIDINL